MPVGADDNGSGSVGGVAIAKVMAANPVKLFTKIIQTGCLTTFACADR